MNKTISLIKVLMKRGTSGVQNNSKKNKSNWWVIPLIIIAFLPMVFSIIDFSKKLYSILAIQQQEGIILSISIAASAIVVTFFGIFYMLSTLYFSEDIETLLPLPIKQGQILTAKFVTVLIYEYLIMLITYIPIAIMWGVMAKASPIYYLYCLIIFFLLPVVPLTISGIISIIIMSLGRGFKDRDKFKLIAGVIAMVVAFGFNIVIQKYTQSSASSEKLMEMMINGENSLVSITSKIYPGSIFAAKTLIKYEEIMGLINLLIFLGFNTLVFIVYLLFGKLFYFSSVLNVNQTSGKRKTLQQKDFKAGSFSKGGTFAYFIKELKLLIRTPIYFLNCVLISFIWPVMIVIIMNTESKTSFSLIKNFVKQADWVNQGGLAIAVGVGVMIFIGASNSITATAISREGQNFYVNKYLPLSFMNQIRAKIWSGLTISLLSVFLIALVAIFLFGVPWFIVLLSIISGYAGMLCISYIGIIIDISRPKLNWDNEQKAVKQNINNMITMFGGFALAFITYLAGTKLDLGLIMTIVFYVLVFGAIDLILYKMISTRIINKYEQI